MKKKTPDRHGLHLMSTEEAALMVQQPDPTLEEPESPPPATELDSFLLQGIRRYEEVSKEFDRELFGSQDLEKMGALLKEKHLLRERLASYGVRVRQ